MNTLAFIPPFGPGNKLDVGRGYAEQVGQELYEVVVGLVIHRWGGDADFKTVAKRAGGFVMPCPGLDVD